jgi:O-antigen ligase
VPDKVFELMNKEPTLTYRTFIWDYAIDFFYKNKIFGTGYGYSDISHEIGKFFSVFGNIHNEALDALVRTGIIGLTFLIIIYARAIINAFNFVKETHFSKKSVFFLSCLIFTLFVNITERTSNLFNTEWFFILLFQFPEFFENLKNNEKEDFPAFS